MKKTLLFGLFMLIASAVYSQTIQSQGLPFTVKPVSANINDLVEKVRSGLLKEVEVVYTPKKKTGYPDDMPMPVDAKFIPSVGVNTQTPDPTLPNAVSPAPSINFTGLIDNNATIPPDVQGAVGPNHIFTVLNSQYRYHDRTGTTISTISPSTFWSPTGITGPFDPNIVYDPYNNRWIFCVTASSRSANSALLVAVSQTNDPTGTWNFYAIDADVSNLNWLDYPSVGFNKDWITITGNLFTNAASSFAGARIYVFDKINMYAGGVLNATNTTTITDATIGGTHTPAFTYDNTLAKQYMLQQWNSAGATWRMWEITGTTHPLTMTSLGFPTNSSAWSSSRVLAPQSGVIAAQYIETNDVRMQSVVYRNGKLWGTQSIFLPSTSPTRSAVQAWEINPTGLVVNQTLRIDDNTATQHYYFPSIAVNASNDVLLGFSQSSATTFASSSYALRLGTYASGTIDAPYLYKAGLAKYFKTFSGTSNRWGDYTSTVVDPVNDTDFWTVQEYAETASGGNDRWATHWAKVSISLPNSITVSSPSSLTLCANKAYNIPFTIVGTYNTGNQFIAQISDNTGSFTTPLPIGTLTSVAAGTISGTPPNSILPGGIGYKLRIVSTNPSVTSSNDFNITIIPQTRSLSTATAAPYEATENINNSGNLTISGTKEYKAGKAITFTPSSGITIGTAPSTVFTARIVACPY